MSRHIVKVWNQTVTEDDILYCLGDWSFGGLQNIWNFRKQLRCKNIHLCLGNHDSNIKNDKQIQLFGEDRDLYQYLTGESANSFNGGIVGVKTLFSSVQDVLTVKHGKHSFFLSHYSHRIWLGSHKEILHLYGHSHDSLDKNGEYHGKSMDCGIDSAKRISPLKKNR